MQINIINYLDFDPDNKIKIVFCKSDSIDYNMEMPLSGNLIEINSGIDQFNYNNACIRIDHGGIISEYLFYLRDTIILDNLYITIENGNQSPVRKINNIHSINCISYYEGCGFIYLFKCITKFF